MSYISLDKLYKIFTPRDVATLKIDVPTQSKDIYQILNDLFLDPNCNFNTFNNINLTIDNHFKGEGQNEESKQKLKSERKETGKIFHMIGEKITIDLSDDLYWGEVGSLRDMIPSLNSGDFEAAKERFTASAYALRSPFVNPSTRGTDKIDMFLNSMPSIVVSQMVPYLDVEFKFQGASQTTYNTPGPLRFLLGSTSIKDSSQADIMMKNAEYSSIQKETQETDSSGNSQKKIVELEYAMTGMEHFLMPQTLTNMDTLGPSSARLVKAKPFLPFASILSFDVNVINAGAGKFSHKKGTLKFSIHDKGRLGEMAEFIRGSSGFNQALVWITYGWLAPMNRSDEDEYSKFINENMMVRECWQIVNSQFSFDASGQVSLSLELVSKAAKILQDITISETDAYLREFHKVIQSISEARSKAMGGENKFSISVQSEQILNAGSTNGVFTDVKSKDIQQSINNLVKSLKKSALSSDELKDLETKLKSLTDKGAYSHSQVETNVGTVVKNQFDKLRDGPDPFLASGRKGTDTELGYFSDANLSKAIASFNQTPENRVAAVKGTTGKKSPDKSKKAAPKKPDPIATQIKTLKPVVSFGKLFLYFVVPAIAKSHTCNELQVFFYGFNDKCGPISGQSIAEFPVNVVTFAHAYAEYLKTSGTEDLNLETFMRLLIETQFSDQRAIGYGMNSFYKPWDKDNPGKAELSEDKTAEEGMAKWLEEYGTLKMPVIEIYVEAGEEGTSNKKPDIVANLKRGTYQREKSELETKNSSKESQKFPEKRLIKRIHVYDKQCNPYRLMQSIIQVGDVLQLGQIDTASVRSKLKKLYDKLDSRQKDKLEELIKENKKAKKGEQKNSEQLLQEASGGSITSADTQGIVVKELPYGKEITLTKDRESLKAFLTKSIPTISVGTNGSLITAANVASKTDGLMGAINIINANKSQASGKATLSNNSLEEAGGLPLRAVPMQVTMTSLGVPTSQLYQTFFIDFNTGTTIDNIYNCTQLQHSISPGKFMTNWTFAYTDGYGKFSAPPSEDIVKSGQLDNVISEARAAAEEAKKKVKGKKK